jgi:hypothetical protein
MKIQPLTIPSKKNRFKIGVFSAVFAIVLGAGFAFATGIASPAYTHADDFGASDPIEVSGDFSNPIEVSTGDFGSTDFGSISTDLGTTDIAPNTTDNTPIISDVPVPGNNDLSPCCTDLGTTDILPNTTDNTPIISDVPVPGNNDLSPCCTDIPVVDTPPIDIPPVVVIPPPVIIPPVIVTPPPPTSSPAVCIALTATPNQISPGDAVTLAWQTQYATSITIDNGVGSVTPVAGGSIIVHPTTNTTYIATVSNAEGSVHCQASVVVTNTPPPPGPACVQLTASATSITPGQAVTLNWVTSNASAISIDNGVGSVTPVASGSTTVNPTGTITYTATVPGATINPACSVTVTVIPQGCTSNCGGGGGGGSSGGGGGYYGGSSGQIIHPIIQAPAAAYVYLSQIPYTGLDLGPVGTIVYWTLIALWCLAAAYIIIFIIIPFIRRNVHSFGSEVSHLVNQPAGALAVAGVAHGDSHQPVAHAPVAHAAVASHAPVADGSAYATSEGFRSFAKSNTLTIDDIVKGLSRLPVAPASSPSIVAHATELPRSEQAFMQPVEQSMPHTVPQAAPRSEAAAAVVSTDVRDFVAALLAGNRDTVFMTLRQIVREGGDAEIFMTQVVCALDDAYRNRLENTKVNAEIARLTANCATSFLEKLTSALTNAVDSSYSPGVTGSKLALTRALGVVEG